MKIVSVVGTRPQFLKLFPIAEQFKKHHIQHIIVHSGQHYDDNMSSVFFEIFNQVKVDYYLDEVDVIELEYILKKENPDYTFVYGDCTTTLIGAKASKYMKIPIVHVESGLRSNNQNMPEEHIRRQVDHMSTILFCPTEYAVKTLDKEGITKNVFLTGNLQIELLHKTLQMHNDESILNRFGIVKNGYHLMTIHRNFNTNRETIKKICFQLESVRHPIIFPVHPRTRKIIEKNNIKMPASVKMVDPVDCLCMSILLRHCNKVITDSGGLQMEAYYLDKPCIVVRKETEWTHTVKEKRNFLVDDIDTLASAVINFELRYVNEKNWVNTNASELIVDAIRIMDKILKK